jgi:hypothetical protein
MQSRFHILRPALSSVYGGSHAADADAVGRGTTTS